MPIALQHLCPVYISIAGIGAIAAVVMSSMDSTLLSSSSMFTYNIYKKIIRKKVSLVRSLDSRGVQVVSYNQWSIGFGQCTWWSFQGYQRQSWQRLFSSLCYNRPYWWAQANICMASLCPSEAHSSPQLGLVVGPEDVHWSSVFLSCCGELLQSGNVIVEKEV